MPRPSTKERNTDYPTLLDYHANRLTKLPPAATVTAFNHFIGALQGMCEPKSLINPGPNREAILRALECAVNRATGS